MNWLRRYPAKFLWRAYLVALVLSFVLGLIWLYTHTLHFHFPFQYIPEFFALFGFFGCILLILIVKGIGFFIVVDEDYYQKKTRSKK